MITAGMLAGFLAGWLFPQSAAREDATVAPQSPPLPTPGKVPEPKEKKAEEVVTNPGPAGVEEGVEDSVPAEQRWGGWAALLDSLGSLKAEDVPTWLDRLPSDVKQALSAKPVYPMLLRMQAGGVRSEGTLFVRTGLLGGVRSDPLSRIAEALRAVGREDMLGGDPVGLAKLADWIAEREVGRRKIENEILKRIDARSGSVTAGDAAGDRELMAFVVQDDHLFAFFRGDVQEIDALVDDLEAKSAEMREELKRRLFDR